MAGASNSALFLWFLPFSFPALAAIGDHTFTRQKLCAVHSN